MPAVGESDLASLFPAGTQLYAETRDLGLDVQERDGGPHDPDGARDAPRTRADRGPSRRPASRRCSTSSRTRPSARASERTGRGSASPVRSRTRRSRATAWNELLGIVGAMASQDDAGIEVTEADVDGTTVTTITLPEEATEDMQVGGMPFAVESLSIADQRWHAAVRHGRLRDGRARLRRQRLARIERGLHRRPSATSTPNLGLVYADIGGAHDHARSAALIRHGRLGRHVALGRWPRPVRRGRHGGRLGHLGPPDPLRGLSASERLYHAPGAASRRPASRARSA